MNALAISLIIASQLGQALPTYVRKSGDRMTGSLRLDAHTIAADDATPSIAGANIFVTSANTGATAITDLDNPLAGQQVVICGGSNANSSTIADAGNFNLSSAITLSLDVCIMLLVQADNDYVEITRSNASAWVGTATSNLDMATFAITFGTDPADTGDIRLENSTNICWESSPAGSDLCVAVDSTERFAFVGAVSATQYDTAQSGADVADTGTFRLASLDSLCWEIAAGGVDECITFNASDVWAFDNPISFGSDPGDTLSLRFSNGGGISWEVAPTGTDVTATVSSNEIFTIAGSSGMSHEGQFTHATFQSATVNAATTFALTATYVDLQCTGAETINTITGAIGTGTILYLQNTDSECTIADDDSPTASDAIDLTGSASDVGSTAKVLTLIYNGTSWLQLAESDN